MHNRICMKMFDFPWIMQLHHPIQSLLLMMQMRCAPRRFFVWIMLLALCLWTTDDDPTSKLIFFVNKVWPYLSVNDFFMKTVQQMISVLWPSMSMVLVPCDGVTNIFHHTVYDRYFLKVNTICSQHVRCRGSVSQRSDARPTNMRLLGFPLAYNWKRVTQI